MSNGDFEVMPIGTMEEVREVRRITRELIALDEQYGANVPQPVRIKILELSRFYHYHAEKFPVIV